MKTQHEILMQNPEYRRLYAIEGVVTDAADLVSRLMEQQGVTKADLSRKLGKSRAWVTQLLSGKANMTIRTFAEVTHVLGAHVRLAAETQQSKQTSAASVKRGAIVYEIPGVGLTRRVQAEFQFASDGVVSMSEPDDQTDNSERPGFAA